MKKNYILLSGLVLASCLGFAQNSIGKFTEPQVEAALSSKALSNDPDFSKDAQKSAKAFGDTLFSTGFPNGIPTGWTVVNNNANSFQWVWNNTYQSGQFSMGTPAITSTSAADGFMVLTGDFFNTPIPTTGAVPMDTYFESPTINLTSGGTNPTGVGSVWVTYQQSLRYCCSSANRLVLQVSNDNFITFQEYDATDGIAVNAASGTTTNVINISTAAANSADIKIRFLSSGNSHYYWMIDDFAVIEGVENDLELTNDYMQFNSQNYGINPFYGQIPYDLFSPLPFSAEIYNNGSNTLTNVSLDINIDHIADTSGVSGTGTGTVYSTSMNTSPSTVVSGAISDSTLFTVTGLPEFVPLVLGDFRVDFLANSDSIDGNIGNETATGNFTTTHTVFGRDDGLFGGGTGPASYVDAGGTPGGTAVGDRFGTMYIVESRTGNGLHTVPTSVTFAVSVDVRNIGVEIVPKIWQWSEDSATVATAFGAEVASSFIPYTVTAADTGAFLTLPFDNGSGTTFGLDSGQYVVGWETTSIAGGTTFEVRNDATTAAKQDNVTSFVYMGHAPGWGWVDVNPVIRLNLDSLPNPNIAIGLTDVTSANVEFSVNPNPNNGEFKLTVSTDAKTSYNLNVRNMLGQSIYTEVVNVNGTMTKQLDLRAFEKGVYFVSLENEAEKIVKKVILK